MQFKSFGYYILKLLTWPMQLFPLQFHYLISDALYVLIYRIVKYRIKVVRTNLSNSFPGKSQTEIQQIEKNFYHGFSDMFIETLYFTHINVKKHNKRLILNNVENLTHPIAQGRNVIVVAGHFGNWEFMQLFAKKIETNKYFIYKKLNNKAFDRFYSELRSRAAQPLEMKETARVLLSKSNHPFTAYFISDQRPVPEEIKYWVKFMNQETPVLLGTEKIANKTNAVVVYLEVKKIKRGYHQASFTTLCENASTTATHEITDRFFEMLEQSINKSPDQYFWTHKRWKYKHEMFTK
jgi:KDO2-lipid IV(A) lauroyltransferase